MESSRLALGRILAVCSSASGAEAASRSASIACATCVHARYSGLASSALVSRASRSRRSGSALLWTRPHDAARASSRRCRARPPARRARLAGRPSVGVGQSRQDRCSSRTPVPCWPPAGNRAFAGFLRRADRPPRGNRVLPQIAGLARRRGTPPLCSPRSCDRQCSTSPKSWPLPRPGMGPTGAVDAISATEDHRPGLPRRVRRQRLLDGRCGRLFVRPVAVPVLHLPRRAGRLFRRRDAGQAGRRAAVPDGARAGGRGHRAGGDGRDGPEPLRPADVRRLHRAVLRHQRHREPARGPQRRLPRQGAALVSVVPDAKARCSWW